MVFKIDRRGQVSFEVTKEEAQKSLVCILKIPPLSFSSSQYLTFLFCCYLYIFLENNCNKKQSGIKMDLQIDRHPEKYFNMSN